jgi:hypothetical protein
MFLEDCLSRAILALLAASDTLEGDTYSVISDFFSVKAAVDFFSVIPVYYEALLISTRSSSIISSF